MLVMTDGFLDVTSVPSVVLGKLGQLGNVVVAMSISVAVLFCVVVDLKACCCCCCCVVESFPSEVGAVATSFCALLVSSICFKVVFSSVDGRVGTAVPDCPGTVSLL